jgi:hypothetical protein
MSKSVFNTLTNLKLGGQVNNRCDGVKQTYVSFRDNRLRIVHSKLSGYRSSLHESNLLESL